jgi:hypothetical protein
MAGAKRQRTLTANFFRAAPFKQEQELPHVMAASNSTNSDKKLGHVEAARLLWKDKWILDFNWLEFNSELGKVFCKVCKEAGGREHMQHQA